MTPAVAVVVDASVARAAGGADASDPVSCACRDVLMALRAAKLRLAMSGALHDEWHRHASAFTRKWLVSMHARRRVQSLTPTPCKPLHAACAQLPPGRSRRAVEKDLHLVDTAFAADRRVVSRDDAVRCELLALAERVTPLRRLLWGDPLDHDCLAWVCAGTPDVARYRLRPGTNRGEAERARAARPRSRRR